MEVVRAQSHKPEEEAVYHDGQERIALEKKVGNFYKVTRSVVSYCTKTDGSQYVVWQPVGTKNYSNKATARGDIRDHFGLSKLPKDGDTLYPDQPKKPILFASVARPVVQSEESKPRTRTRKFEIKPFEE